MATESETWQEINDLNYITQDGDAYKMPPNGRIILFSGLNKANLSVKNWKSNYPKIIIYKKVFKPRFECSKPYPYGY